MRGREIGETSPPPLVYEEAEARAARFPIEREKARTSAGMPATLRNAV
ncbi:hypothetical protein BH160DRAFT_0088 [Burkholderia sp. H160]|nr:hypothetical protein BH160DRAFT_0088 [Burkholderia sp. H160]